ncbi:hypothetical protein AGABI1DRAFT_127406 [Agaricus bisporus var. burnettii JB137-S8]|uniref:Uncharacterized protein n=1 Tax=Agaricus bisporus var. burnettii (strain JB137-S8 / ATCC MYA-4627 / FGSC 10392) TaxID=597362 RepID=K5XWU0_AGABU|nr:uncharacterized protein AGABI1DRAFT_127406 [Agaricus bisporus var. burnettii JB137-S8]EKM79720.1 hypothetical protein AGABI1DRAFT_127406 [Agaricus bisporus var. burnettii JB137-S8]
MVLGRGRVREAILWLCHITGVTSPGFERPSVWLMVDSITARFRNIFKKSESAPEVNLTEGAADTSQVEPVSFALQIQSLVENLPLPTSTPNSAPSQDGNQALPPSPPQDSKLMRMLRNTAVMNGSRGTNVDRPSIWSILERLRSPQQNKGPTENDPNSDDHRSDDDVSDLFSDSSSVMLYSPLLPARGSLVELADSEVTIDVVEEVGEDEEEGEEVGGPEILQSGPPIPGWTWANVLPSFDWFTQPAQSTSAGDNDPALTPRTRERQLRAQASRVWIPSKEQLSIQCLWWGYRMFLPPPVLDILNDRQLEAARRTVMITTALTWFFNNLPIDSLPPPLRPTLLLIKHIAPYLSYIGTFISWSWGTMASYDQGCGITLTATWILPFALIPGTWFERDWPMSPPKSPRPLPGTSSPQIEPVALQSEAHSPTTLIYTMTPPASPRSPPSTISTSTQLPNTPPSPGPSILLPPPSDPRSSVAPSSPALSFVTAPGSPPPLSPKRNPLSLAGLVAKSPLIRVRRIRSKQSLNPASIRPPHHSPSPLSQSHSPLDPEFGYSVSPSPLYSTTLRQTPIDASSSGVSYPSPPAHPRDLRLLQSPMWECSPLPSEDSLPQEERNSGGKGKRFFARRQS